MNKDPQFYELLARSLREVLTKIVDEKDALLSKAKPIDRPDTRYANRIMSCIMYICNKNRVFNDEEINDYFSVFENAKWEFDRVMDINYLINCTYGIDYLLTKKAVCMMFGMSIDTYQNFLNFGFPSRPIFVSIEEYLIAGRQEGAETFTRNVVAIDTNLKTKSEFGGYNVEQVSPKTQNNGKKEFDAINASVEEISTHLDKLLGTKKNKKEIVEVIESEN